MANMALLNNVDHSDLKVITRPAAEFGDHVNMVTVVPTEFGELQREYAILFRKADDGQLGAIVLTGFDKGENLYVSKSGWLSNFVPAQHQRGPFSIGFQEQDVDGEKRNEPVLLVDLDDPRVSKEEGHPVFLPQGGNSPYLDHVTDVMQGLGAGQKLAPAMFAAFEEYDLIEPVTLEVTLDQSTKYKLPDMYTISEQRLSELNGEALERLNQAGFLRYAFMVLASLPNFRRLIAMKNAKRAAEQQGR